MDLSSCKVIHINESLSVCFSLLIVQRSLSLSQIIIILYLFTTIDYTIQNEGFILRSSHFTLIFLFGDIKNLR